LDNEAALPSSGTTDATVTVTDGRPAGVMRVCDYIESSNPINAPGGFAPVLPP
jgi:hypothetical protein